MFQVFKCIQKGCDKTCEDLEAFLQHLNVHVNKAQYHCHVCSKEFASLDDLGLHQHTHRTPVSYTHLDVYKRQM